MMNVSMSGSDMPGADPLRLRDLPEPRPEAGRLEQDWAAVSAALEADRKRRRHTWIGGLAAAASVVLVVALLNLPRPEPAAVERAPMTEATAAQPSTAELMAMSQDMEQQLRFMREQVGSMPSEVAIYQVELQDLISQVDDALSLAPDSNELWGQRLGLQIDLVKLYRSQLRRDHLRLASW